jgi:hypothetical protein
MARFVPWQGAVGESHCVRKSKIRDELSGEIESSLTGTAAAAWRNSSFASRRSGRQILLDRRFQIDEG